ncbi:hypothetical protein TNCV_4753891 [Trichonephila clavipes]|nr:hypothetical protein TNCV_4753891 [Trichonephila clavipes]
MRSWIPTFAFSRVQLTLISFSMRGHIEAHLIDEFLKSEDFRQMVCPARSPDLNPEEHALDALGRVISTRNAPARAIQGLKTALVKE